MSTQHFIRGYLRASTDDQNASRARATLEQFAKDNGVKVASWYTENASGTKTDRSELMRLLTDSHAGDVLLIEQVDRLTRLTKADWDTLKTAIKQAGVRIVSLDLPTSHAAMKVSSNDDFTARMLDAVNAMLLDMLAAIARKDYEDRRRRQAEGIAQAKSKGVYRGRPIDQQLRNKVTELKAKGFSIRKTAELAGCAPSTVQRILKEDAAA
ncbi:recombinase family protein [Klebsiella quasipneumoniae]|uniref:recombinase family protein n=1 Tax=Klebsiella quasipneumoniae TaxID=1463165 RepID=UPI0029D68615|nr:recombinase family protein [Cronobacter malonaticus]HCM7852099.1 recombinase family protein [Klebsiella pneumoniae]